MNKNLLIIGAGIYGLVAKEIAESMNCFEKIVFADDKPTDKQGGLEIVGRVDDIERLIGDYNNVVVAIGNPKIRFSLLQKLEALPCEIVTLIAPQAYISFSAQIGKGVIVEPMAVVQAQARLAKGCIISAGAVVNHGAVCGECVHVDCNATISGYAIVDRNTKIESGEVFKRECDDISKRTP